eukprot:COSAG04_NODE_10373_length_782_cov_1.814056_2_plen_91_part_00
MTTLTFCAVVPLVATGGHDRRVEHARVRLPAFRIPDLSLLSGRLRCRSKETAASGLKTVAFETSCVMSSYLGAFVIGEMVRTPTLQFNIT